jgi:pimeloyl-ACP methyl ester carboxylesterase
VSTSQVSLFGSQVQYWTHGPADGRTVLMVHGLRGNHIALLRIAEGMQGFRVIVPDLPGFGASTPMTGLRHDVAGYGVFIKAFIAELRLDRPVLLGESFGSVIASRVAASEPDLVSELILLNPIAVSPREINRPLCRIEEGYYWLGANLPEPLAKRVLESRAVNRIESLALLTARDRPTRRAVYDRRLYNLGFPQDIRVIAEAFPDSIALTAADEAERIPHRTLIVGGEKDALCPARYQHRLRDRLARGTLTLIPDTGHFMPLETPSEVARAIVEFLG